MPSTFSERDLVPFPPGENSSNVIINSIHFNRTALHFFNYTLYSNGTLSNGSNCYLAFHEYKPSMLANGTFVNGTSCYSPINGIGPRSGIGIAFGALFGLTIIITLINLRKHGRMFLPNEKRWRAVGRRWQWYWMLFVAACGIISTLTGIDVDRDYLPSLAIVLQSFFYYLMLPAVLAMVWESVRHWGSWQERQICDADPYGLPQDDFRSRSEFYLPLIFYLFAFLNFFMTIPRAWSPIEMQRSDQQTSNIARPAATDLRVKLGAGFAVVAWAVILYDLQHNVYYYKTRRKGTILSIAGLSQAPPKFLFAISLTAMHVGYACASSTSWQISPLNLSVNPGWIYGLGYAPAILIIIILNIYGYIDPNEDRELLAQRIARGRSIDAELGITTNKKPSSWSRLNHNAPRSGGLSTDQRLRDLAEEIGRGRRLAPASAGDTVEMVGMGNVTDPNNGGGPFADSHAINHDDDDDDGANDARWPQRKISSSQPEIQKHAGDGREGTRHVWNSPLLEDESEATIVAPRGAIDGSERQQKPLMQEKQGVVRSMLDI